MLYFGFAAIGEYISCRRLIRNKAKAWQSPNTPFRASHLLSPLLHCGEAPSIAKWSHERDVPPVYPLQWYYGAIFRAAQRSYNRRGVGLWRPSKCPTCLLPVPSS